MNNYAGELTYRNLVLKYSWDFEDKCLVGRLLNAPSGWHLCAHGETLEELKECFQHTVDAFFEME